MSLEGAILSAAVAGSLVSLLFTPKTKRLEMQFIILFVQMPTWVLGLSAVELGLLEYPYRELASANRTSFIFEYIFLPVVCVHMNNHYPWRASAATKALYLAGIGLALTGLETVLEQYTLLIRYTGWEWDWTWLSLAGIFGLTQKTVDWFFSRR